MFKNISFLHYFKKVLVLLVLSLVLFWPKSSTIAKETFIIDHHSIDVVVNEDGSLDIVEKLTVSFQSNQHGIYVNIPTKYKMMWNIDGKEMEKSYFFPVKDIKLLSSQKYKIEEYDDYKRIVIGDKKQYAPKHSTYQFSYTIVTRDLDLDGKQMLYLKLISDGWETSTTSCDFTISFPKDFSNEDIKMYYPGGTTNGLVNENNLVLQREGNILKGSYGNIIEEDESISIQVMLDDDYFNFESFNKPAIIIVMFSSLFTLVVFALFLLKGRDKALKVTSCCHLPSGITSSEVGLFIDEEVSDNDLISLFLDWGRRGNITIKEIGGDLYLTKINDLGKDSHRFERIIFEKLFMNKKEVCLDKLSKDFSNTLLKAKEALQIEYQQKKKRLSTSSSLILQKIFIIIGFIPVTAFISILYYFYSYSIKKSICIVLIMALVLMITNGLACSIYQRRYMYKLKKRILLYSIVIIIYIGLFLALLEISKLTNIDYRYWLSEFILQVVILLITIFMRKRTDYGQEMLEKVLGLRKFILEADDRKIEEINEENAFYYYDILPFAYAMGLTDIWDKHFENIKVNPCDWFGSDVEMDTNESFYMMYLLCNQLDSFKDSMRSIDEYSSSDGGSYPDSSSSGGFGGTSGGSW